MAGAEIREAIRFEPRHEVGRRVVERRGPDVRAPAERREEHEHLGQTPVEGSWVSRPTDALEPVPERLGFDGIVEQERVVEVAQIATRDGMDARLVEEEAAHRVDVDHVAVETDPAQRSYLPREHVRSEEEGMSRRMLAWLGGIALVAAACSSSGGSTASTAAGPACSEATGAGTVTVSIKDFMFEPATISAKAGDLVTFTNAGEAPHNATLDAGGCATSTLQPGSADGLRFTVAGTYPFHCTVHTQMKGTITVGA